MKTLNRIFSSLLTVMLLVLCLAPAASAATPKATIDITGKTNTFVFGPGSKYSDTDLFNGFKDVYPGDTLRQEVYITHKGVGLGSFKLFMRVVPHDHSNLPQAPVLAAEGSVENMNDFLSQLHLTIWKGKDTSVTPIFDGKASEADGLSQYKQLAVFKKGLTGVLTVELEVPIEMGNEFADRIGEVDWEFMIEEIPAPIIPQTGDTTNIGVLIAVSVVSLAAIIVVVILLLRKKKN